MKQKKQTIFALSTPYAQSAVAVIRISGDSCLKVASRLLKKNFHMPGLISEKFMI